MRTSDIVVVGSHVYGSYIDCDRLPRPGETVSGSNYRACVLDDGGKGSNQALCSARLGASTTLVGMIGSDEPGQAAMGMLASEGCDVSHVARHPVLPTGVSVALIEPSGMSVIVTDPGANTGVTAEFVEANRDVIARHRFCLTQFEIPLAAALKAARIASEEGVRAMVTPGPMQPLGRDDLDGIDILIPNETETMELLGSEADGLKPAELVRALAGRWGLHNVVMTQGSRGVVCFWEGQVVGVPAFEVEARNTIGAGDGFAAALASALCRKMEIEDALIFASAVSAIAVMHPGAPWSSYPGPEAAHAFLASRGLARLAHFN
ncbi:ribokinase [Mesorhizobium sp. BAC0120]|uniref:ribokinase n=1 Tax=Mesorhizobium sp. BAC0120 TaxID=3090670 RepID=UPI00298CD05A|nr:ribokinase [Mesorhizobium sp. BAC0120]MDW6023663.1 ribokinase [Mesorhizobium sp. BAC0120]